MVKTFIVTVLSTLDSTINKYAQKNKLTIVSTSLCVVKRSLGNEYICQVVFKEDKE